MGISCTGGREVGRSGGLEVKLYEEWRGKLTAIESGDAALNSSGILQREAQEYRVREIRPSKGIRVRRSIKGVGSGRFFKGIGSGGHSVEPIMEASASTGLRKVKLFLGRLESRPGTAGVVHSPGLIR